LAESIMLGFQAFICAPVYSLELAVRHSISVSMFCSATFEPYPVF
jgi:hypothetical protein